MEQGKHDTRESNSPQGQDSPQRDFVTAPSIALPKGGGAIKGMGEKFSANPVTGTGSMSVPIETSPSRSGFNPTLSLSYDSGVGNNVFGLGWSLSLAAITRKTDKGLPQYQDADESDVFILSGAEDLVPVMVRNSSGVWEREKLPLRTVGAQSYTIQRYIPRIEGLFAKIERWNNILDASDNFWRVITKDNKTTWYGLTSESRIYDPDDATHIYSWLMCQSHDDKGDVISYRYQAENSDGVDLTLAHEQNRTVQSRTANRYLKRILYGNHQPYLPVLKAGTPWPVLPANDQWLFEVVLDYGEHDPGNPLPVEPGKSWPVRNDPYSSYRAGFEVRTYRLCRRILMFHHFPNEAGIGANCLVRSTDFRYGFQQDPASQQNTIFSLLLAAHQTGYTRQTATTYLAKSLPPVEFDYSAVLTPEQLRQQPIRSIDQDSMVNMPTGIDATANYQWLDLDGEGLSGLLAEQGRGWFYKRNQSANNQCLDPDTNTPYTAAQFGALEQIALKPNALLSGASAQFMDLAGDGQTDLVLMDGPVRGFYERTVDEDWASFQPFSTWPNFNSRDPNLKFIDLNGDGHADLLISEDQAFIWHASLAEAGYAPAQRVMQAMDEEKGPRLIFADSAQSIYLADFSGDGLTDIARIRNGEVCYWPNLGYGRFGAKVSMDHAPWFDRPDLFEQGRIRLADLDGSGVTDILYLHGDGVKLYFNQSGNSWSAPVSLNNLPATDNIKSVSVVDLLGNGTACLVWSSRLASDAQRAMHYLDLMGGLKPHLLIKSRNNMGSETEVRYAPSTKFYLADKQQGKPWVTKLPFPVHCVEQVIITDQWRKSRFVHSYAYHHGYFDGVEREFRGFGRVEQIDVESFGEFAAGNADSPYITADHTLYQPPIKTTTWYHTGAFLDRDRILSQFEHEYFPHWLEEQHPALSLSFQEHALPKPDLDAQNLSDDEWREALRACKGMMLRQEVVELDIDALESSSPVQRVVKLYSTAYHNCQIQTIQPQGDNRHGVFLATESEAITYHYELDLHEEQLLNLQPDPRIAHTLHLQIDRYANILQSVDIVYPRIGEHLDSSLSADALSRIHAVQAERHLAYTETRYTEDFGSQAADQTAALDHHRLRLPCEVLTYALTGLTPAAGFYFSLTELRALWLSQVLQSSGTPVAEIPYQQISTGLACEKRLVEHSRTLYFAENLQDALPLGQHGRLGLRYELYTLALTTSLLDVIFSSSGLNKLDQSVDGSQTARDRLDDPALSGYLSGAALVTRFAGVPAGTLAGQYWIRSGIAGYAVDAAQHFYLPERYSDAFGNVTTLQYDSLYDLYLQSSTDAMGNTTQVNQFDFRVLAPRVLQDINDNLSEVYFDALGMPVAMALKGKGSEGDSLSDLTDLLANPSTTDLTAFFAQAVLDEGQLRSWLGNATARYLYYSGEVIQSGQTVWGVHPACSCTVLRETHVSQLALGVSSPLQVAFEYSDGMGSVIVHKTQAEPEQPGQPLRWIASGKTILNNKGNAVKQYQPYFSSVGHQFEEPLEEGVTEVLYYDALSRVVRTELPDGSYSRIEVSPWHMTSYDANDTAFDPTSPARSDWYQRRMNPAHPRYAEFHTPENVRAAQAVESHGNTPTQTLMDSLGRQVITISHNRVQGAGGLWTDEKYLTFTKLDAEGKPLWVRDARRNLVMQYIMPPVANNQPADPVAGFVPCYDIAGNLLYQHSMDAGDRWMLNDAAGKPMLAWNSRGHTFRTDYDGLHRRTGSFVKGADPADSNRIIQHEKLIYGDTPGNGLSNAKLLNLRGKPYQHHDTASVVINLGQNPVTSTDEAFDFKGNLLRSTRRLLLDYTSTPDWSQSPLLASEVFSSSSRFDAINRPIQHIAPHSSQPNSPLNIIRVRYNEASLLDQVSVWLGQSVEPAGLLNPVSASLSAITRIDYDAKGQRTQVAYNEAGHPVLTTYDYDPETYRLSRLLTTRPQHPDATKRTLQDLSYTYDPVANVTEIRDDAQQTVFFNNSSVAPSNAYVYDALYRLTRAEGREHAVQNNIQRDGQNFAAIIAVPFPNSPEALQRYREDYAYDAVGNILALQHSGGGSQRWVRWYQYALDSNRLLATRAAGDNTQLPYYAASPGYSAKYSYDAHGNMTSMPNLPVLSWDFKDQLHSSQQQVVNNGVGERTYYVYDASGQRVRKVTELASGQPKDERIYLGGFELYRKYGASGQTLVLQRETLHVMDDHKRIALVETRTLDVAGNDPAPAQLIRYQLGNHLGSAAIEIDDQAQVISYEEFHPYGTTAYHAARSQAESAKRYRYTGKERDEETGLGYHGARYYASWLGRWVSCDPIGVGDGLNIYAYVHDNPLSHIDPDGTFTKKTYDDFLDKQIKAGEKEVAKDTKKLADSKKEKAAADKRLADIAIEEAKLNKEKKDIAAKRLPLETKKTKLTKKEAADLKELKKKNTKVVNAQTKLSTEKANLKSDLIRLAKDIPDQEAELKKDSGRVKDLKDLKKAFDDAYSKATAKLPKADVEMLTDIVMNEARDSNTTAKKAIAYAYTNDAKHHMKKGHPTAPPSTGPGGISHFSVGVTETRFKATTDKEGYIGQIIQSLDASRERLADTKSTGDISKGATNWVSPGAPGMKTTYPPDGLPSWARAMTQITVKGVDSDDFTFLK